MVIYTRKDIEARPDERQMHKLHELKNIPSVVTDFQFTVQEKYRIATYTPGSGNTRNIGSVTSLDLLRSGEGPFASLGVEVFDDYWMNYMNTQMAKEAGGGEPPYRDIESYLAFKSLPKPLDLEAIRRSRANVAREELALSGDEEEVD